MGRDLISVWYRETTRRERVRYGLGAGCLFWAGSVAFFLLIALFNSKAPATQSAKGLLEFGVALVCISAPLSFMVATGTYVQLTYAGMLRRMLTRWQANNKEENNQPGPPI